MKLTAEKIEKAIENQRNLSGVECFISNGFAFFTRPEESSKYKNVGKVRLSDGKIFPFSQHTRTSRERDAVAFLDVISSAILNETAPEAQEDTRPIFFIDLS